MLNFIDIVTLNTDKDTIFVRTKTAYFSHWLINLVAKTTLNTGICEPHNGSATPTKIRVVLFFYSTGINIEDFM
jgi:hypothetical protein